MIGLGVLECHTSLQQIMGWESSDVVRFDIRTFLQGQTRVSKLKSACFPLIIATRGVECETI